MSSDTPRTDEITVQSITITENRKGAFSRFLGCPFSFIMPTLPVGTASYALLLLHVLAQGAHALHALQSVPTCRTAAANCVSRPCSRSGVLEAVVSNAQAQRPSGLRFVRPHDVVSKRTWNAVQAVTDFEAALFKREGWVVLRQVWAPDEDERNGLPPVQPSRVHTLANCEREPPRDEVQYELAAALAARFLRAAALADPAGGSGLDNAYDHFICAHFLDVAERASAIVFMPTDLIALGLQGYGSQIVGSEGEEEDEWPVHEIDLEVGDALVLDGACTRGRAPLGFGGDHLVYRFAACDPSARGALWRTPQEMLFAMRSQQAVA